MYEELVKKLRSHNGWALNETLDEAADAIEALAKDLEQSKEYEAFWHKEAEEMLRRFQRFQFAVDDKHCWILNPYVSGFVTHWEQSTEPPKEEIE